MPLWNSKPVEPVVFDLMEETLPFLNRHIRGLVEFQRLTGYRPGEACVLRWCDLDTSGAVWVYRPPHYKTAWRGKTRTIAVGPKGQGLLRAFQPTDPT